MSAGRPQHQIEHLLMNLLLADGSTVSNAKLFEQVNAEAGPVLKGIRAERDDSKLKAYQGKVSLPFEAGQNRRAAVKIVDDRGIESLRVLALGPASA